jgi:hypothetical protein
MANTQGEVDLRFAQVSAPQLALWLGLAWKASHSSQLPAYEDGTVCSITSAYKIQTPGNYPEESIQQIDTKFFQDKVVNLLTDQPRVDVEKYGEKCDSNLTPMTSVSK